MSVAPLNGKPTPVLLVTRALREGPPRARAASHKTSPLSSRARRLRRRHRWSVALVAMTLMLFAAAVGWTVMRWRG